MKRLLFISIFSFLLSGNFSVNGSSVNQETQPLLPDFKSFTKQQWANLDPTSPETQTIIETATNYYSRSSSELDELIESYSFHGFFCCRIPKVPEALWEIKRRVDTPLLASFQSPMIQTVVRPKDQKFEQTPYSDDFRTLSDSAIYSNPPYRRSGDLEVGELRSQISHQQDQFEKFRSDMETQMAELVEAEVAKRLTEVESLTQTVKDQQVEIERLRDELAESNRPAEEPHDRRIEALTKEVADQQKRLEKLQEQLLKSQSETSQTNLAHESEYNAESKTQVESLTQENVALASKVNELAELYNSKKLELAKLMETIESLNAQVQKMDKGVASEKKASFKYVIKFAYIVRALLVDKQNNLTKEEMEKWDQILAESKETFKKKYEIEF